MREKLLGLMSAYESHSAGMLGVLGRVLAYSTGALVVMLIAETYFGDTYTANLALFMLFASAFELLRANLLDSSRWLWYTLAVLGMMVAGGFLVNEAMEVRGSFQQGHAIQERIEAMVHASDGPVLATDQTGIIQAVGSRVEELTGYSEQELVGQSIAMLFPHISVTDARLADVSTMGAPGEPGWTIRVLRDASLRRKDGSLVPVAKYIFGLRYSLGRRWADDIQFVSLVTTK